MGYSICGCASSNPTTYESTLFNTPQYKIYMNPSTGKISNQFLQVNKNTNDIEERTSESLPNKNNQDQLNSKSSQKVIKILNPSQSTDEYKGSRNKKGLKNGFGIIKWKGGAVYIGQFESDVENGYGKCSYVEGDCYMGTFVNGEANGFGIHDDKQGKVYCGLWKNNVKHEIGYEFEGNESMYQGEYLYDMKDGVGMQKWNDKSSYLGEWRENYFHGYGIYHYSDGRYYIGQWKKDKMHGYGEFHWRDGKIFCGFYYQNVRAGFGVFYWPIPKIFIGFWIEGKQDGPAKIVEGNIVTYMRWDNGNVKCSYETKEEFYDSFEEDEVKYQSIFKFDIIDIQAYYEIN